jgi:hypothetical protein
MHDRYTRMTHPSASEPAAGDGPGCAPTLAPPEGESTSGSARPEPWTEPAFESSIEIVESIPGRDRTERRRDSMKEHLARCLSDRAGAGEAFRTEPPTWRSPAGT